MVAATGHDNGDVLLWGIQWEEPLSGGDGSTRRLGANDRSSSGGAGVRGKGSSSPVTGVVSMGGGAGDGVGVRPLKLLRVLSGAHQKRVTFVRVCEGGRELLVGDAHGDISRWQCIRLDQLSSEELNQLV